VFDVDVNTNNQVRENTRQPRWRNRMAPSHRITNSSLSVTGRVMVVDDWPGGVGDEYLCVSVPA
jgi:hypothetical protein